MTGNHHNDHTPHSITIHEAFDKLSDYLTERQGPGSTEQGWARLQRALDTDEPADHPAPHRRARAGEIARSIESWWQRSTVKYWAACLLITIGVTTSGTGLPGMLVTVVCLPVGGVLTFYALFRSARRQEAEAEAARLRHQQRHEMRVHNARRAAVRRQTAANKRRIGPLGRMDSSGALDLAGADLTHADLTDLSLIGATLTEATLDGRNLRFANLYEADLSGASMFGIDLSRADLSGADLANADLACAHLIGARLSGAVLSGANLAGANLSCAVLSGADLSGADLSGAILSGADLSGANLSGATLANAYITGAHLQAANLSGADLEQANLRGSYLPRADMTRANLTGATITHAVLRHTVFIGAGLSGAHLPDLTDLEEVTWSETTVWGRYHEDVIKRSIPLGAGRYKLNPPEDTALGPILQPRLPI